MPPKKTPPPPQLTSAERAKLFGFADFSPVHSYSSQSNFREPLRESAKERAAAEAEAARVREKQERDAASDILGISPNSSIEQIRQAYFKLAMKFHPDKCPNDETATEKFKKILNAYEKLTTPMPTGGNKCRNRRRTYHRRTYHITKKTQTHRHATHHRKTHRVRD